MNFRRTLLAAATALAASTPMTQVQAATPSAEAIVSHYADIALATYSDSLNGAKKLQQAIVITSYSIHYTKLYDMWCA